MDQPKYDIDTLYDTWKRRPSPATLTPIVSYLNPVIDQALYGYGYQSDPSAKITAQLYVADTLPKYDKSKGANLKTFMTSELRRLQRILPRQSQAIPIPEQAQLDLKHIQQAETELKDRFNRDPAPNELADHLGLSLRRINTIKAKYGMPTLHAGSMMDEQGAQVVFTDKGQSNPNEDLWQEAVYSDLTPADQNIMDWSMGLHGNFIKSKTEIARRLKISVPAVTQRAAKLKAKLEEGYGMNIL